MKSDGNVFRLSGKFRRRVSFALDRQFRISEIVPLPHCCTSIRSQEPQRVRNTSHMSNWEFSLWVQFKITKIVFVTTSHSITVVQSPSTQFWSLQTFTGFQSTSRNHRVVVVWTCERYKAHSDLCQISRFARFSGFEPPGSRPRGARHGCVCFFRNDIIHTKHALHRLGEFW